MLNKSIRFLIGIFVVLSVTACGPSDTDAQKLGFSSGSQMKELTKRGYKTYQDYLDAASNSPHFCIDLKTNHEDLFDKRTQIYPTYCQNHKALWVGKEWYMSKENEFTMEAYDTNSTNQLVKVTNVDISGPALKDKPKNGKWFLIEGTLGKKGIFTPDMWDAVIIEVFDDQSAATKKAIELHELSEKNEKLNKSFSEMRNPSKGRSVDQMALEGTLEEYEQMKEDANVKGEKGRDEFQATLDEFWKSDGSKLLQSYQGKQITGWTCQYIDPVGWDPKTDNNLLCNGVGKYGYRSIKYRLMIPANKREGLGKIYSNKSITFSGTVKEITRRGPTGFDMDVEDVTIK